MKTSMATAGDVDAAAGQVADDEANPYLGAEVDDDEDLSALDRGDVLEGELDGVEPAPDEPIVDEDDEPADPDEAVEDEDEGEAPKTPEPTDEDEPEDEPKEEQPKVTGQRIPKERFDQINERMKAAEARAKELEERIKAQQPESDFDFDAKEDEYMEALLDGDTAKAKLIRTEIRTAEREAYRTENEGQTLRQTEASLEEQRLNETVATLETEYPVLNSKLEDGYREDLVNEILSIHRGYVAQGIAPSLSLEKATLYVARFHGLEGASQAEPDPAPAKPENKATTRQVERKLASRQSEPPRLSGVRGQTQPAYEVTTMTEEEFDALPSSKLRELRGDAM